MAMFDTPFYHKTIELYHGVFGKIFDNLKVVRKNGDHIKVPIAWASQQKYNVRREQNPDPEKFTHKNRLPRMSFRMIDLVRDPSRTTNKNNLLTENVTDRGSVSSLKTQYNRVPFNFQFKLGVQTKYYEDMLSIIEQIMVYFNPEISVTIQDNPDLNMSSDLTITLDNHQMEDSFEGPFDEDRTIQKDFEFTLKGYLYMPTSNSGIIQQVTLNYYDLDFGNLLDTDTVTPEQ